MDRRQAAQHGQGGVDLPDSVGALHQRRLDGKPHVDIPDWLPVFRVVPRAYPAPRPHVLGEAVRDGLIGLFPHSGFERVQGGYVRLGVERCVNFRQISVEDGVVRPIGGGLLLEIIVLCVWHLASLLLHRAGDDGILHGGVQVLIKSVRNPPETCTGIWRSSSGASLRA